MVHLFDIKNSCIKSLTIEMDFNLYPLQATKMCSMIPLFENISDDQIKIPKLNTFRVKLQSIMKYSTATESSKFL